MFSALKTGLKKIARNFDLKEWLPVFLGLIVLFLVLAGWYIPW